MATGRITLGSLRGLEGWLWDDRVIGFGARRQTRGIFYYLRYRRDGAQVMRSIGRHGSPWTPDTARNEALRLLGSVVGGNDPFAQSLNSESFGAEIERYLLRKKASLKPRSFEEVERYVRKHCAPLHRLKLGEIDRRTIAVLLGQIEQARGPIARNRARSALSDLFSWCITEGLLEINPVQGTAKVDEGASRERVLSQEELRKLWRNLGEDKFSDIVRLLLLTGQRRGEISALAWSEVDLAKGMIILPPARTKNKRQHELPLSRQALTILERQPRRNSSPFLFSDKQGYKDWDTAKTKLDERTRIAPWRLHDLRRTCATQLGELGVQPHHIEAILNHYSGHRSGVAGVYQRAKYADEMRSALQKWADWVEERTR
ncbi:MAG: tyrosine-type recombinase/integrase [Xanthobacteraceae bacterium]